MDRAGPAFDRIPDTPRPGDLGCCIRCGELLEYDQDLHLALLGAKFYALDADTRRQLQCVRQAILNHPRPDRP